MNKINEILKKDNRPNLEKRTFTEVIKAFTEIEKAHALSILLEWSTKSEE